MKSIAAHLFLVLVLMLNGMTSAWAVVTAFPALSSSVHQSAATAEPCRDATGGTTVVAENAENACCHDGTCDCMHAAQLALPPVPFAVLASAPTSPWYKPDSYSPPARTLLLRPPMA